MNYIKDMIIEDDYITFFLQTDDEPDFWYWQVPKADVHGNCLKFVNDPGNGYLGYSVSEFDTLEDAKDYYYRCERRTLL